MERTYTVVEPAFPAGKLAEWKKLSADNDGIENSRGDYEFGFESKVGMFPVITGLKRIASELFPVAVIDHVEKRVIMIPKDESKKKEYADRHRRAKERADEILNDQDSSSSDE